MSNFQHLFLHYISKCLASGSKGNQWVRAINYSLHAPCFEQQLRKYLTVYLDSHAQVPRHYFFFSFYYIHLNCWHVLWGVMVFYHSWRISLFILKTKQLWNNILALGPCLQNSCCHVVKQMTRCRVKGLGLISLSLMRNNDIKSEITKINLNYYSTLSQICSTKYH